MRPWTFFSSEFEIFLSLSLITLRISGLSVYSSIRLKMDSLVTGWYESTISAEMVSTREELLLVSWLSLFCDGSAVKLSMV